MIMSYWRDNECCSQEIGISHSLFIHWVPSLVLNWDFFKCTCWTFYALFQLLVGVLWLVWQAYFWICECCIGCRNLRRSIGLLGNLCLTRVPACEPTTSYPSFEHPYCCILLHVDTRRTWVVCVYKDIFAFLLIGKKLIAYLHDLPFTNGPECRFLPICTTYSVSTWSARSFRA